ncbi:MAG: phosphatidate cytidylyltransferase [Alphaproteobacteria bacterium]|nr:phosphatidate cytidylyltransferase [Alphaproteobacteria bacterium]
MGDWTDPHADKLAVRVASAIALIAGGLTAGYFGGPLLAAVTAAAAVAMSFEWARMSEPKSAPWGFAVGATGALGAVCAAALGAIDAAIAFAGGAAVISALRPGPLAARAAAAFGVIYITLPCVGFVWLRSGPSGLGVLFAMFAVVWAADSAAFFGGRFVGGPRLAPSLSPKKTWSGLGFGVAAAGASGAALAAITGGPWALWTAVGLALGLVGLAGDLFESLCKRHFGVKDASSLIPGHGGVLDRLDSLIAVTVVTLAATLAAPGLTPALFGALA